ncbi:DNA primase [Streptomyces sp. NPDC003470]|uniref:DNA primase n=1 Tax=Streptomyces sp. NPDC127100 TaxID=3347138 RepID=UPI00364C32AA
MNRTGLGLAVGAGYLLGRTKKLKMAIAVGTMVAGKKLNLTPKGIAELVSTQLQNNPQFKEIGDQLRTDLRGVGKAASGAMVERQIGALADRLHGRTAEVRGQLSGESRDSEDSQDAEYEDEEQRDDDRRDEDRRDEADEPDESQESGRRRERPVKKASETARGAAKKAPAKRPAKKAAAKAPAKKTAAKRAQPAKKAAGKKAPARGAGSRQAKGGGE